MTAITEVDTFGQEVTAVAIELGAEVDPDRLDLDTFTVRDSQYNFRFDPVAALDQLGDRTVTGVYTNDEAMTIDSGRSRRGRFVIVELDPDDYGGNTVTTSTCPSFLCYVKVNPDLRTEVVVNEEVHARSGSRRGRVLVAPSATAYGVTGDSVDLLVDDFVNEVHELDGVELRYAYHLPERYRRHRSYPMVVILPGWGMGYDGENLGVQIAADIPATAWLQEEWTGSREDVIVVAPQNRRVGDPAAEARIVTDLVHELSERFNVDTDRVYASTVSYGSTTAWAAMSAEPGLFSAALITGGFQVSPEQAAAIATVGTPIWVTHGLNDHLLPVAFGRTSTSLLREAYVAAGRSPEEAEELVRYTEYGDDAFSQPDHHAAMGPTYEDGSILRWLLAQRS